VREEEKLGEVGTRQGEATAESVTPSCFGAAKALVVTVGHWCLVLAGGGGLSSLVQSRPRQGRIKVNPAAETPIESRPCRV